MTGPARIAAILGLLLLGVIGLFPSLKPPPNFPAGPTGVLGARAFLLSSEYIYYVDQSGGRTGKAGAEIDLGRLFAEALVIGAVAGIGLVALPKVATGLGKLGAPAYRPRDRQ